MWNLDNLKIGNVVKYENGATYLVVRHQDKFNIVRTDEPNNVRLVFLKQFGFEELKITLQIWSYANPIVNIT